MPFNLLFNAPSSGQPTDAQRAQAIRAKLAAGAPVSPSDTNWLATHGGNAASRYGPSPPLSYFDPRSNTWGPGPTATTPETPPSPPSQYGRLGSPGQPAQAGTGFWTRYAQTQVPAGFALESVTTTPSGGHQMNLRVVDYFAARRSGFLAPEQSSEMYWGIYDENAYKADVAANTQKWRALGYPEYGSKYVAPDVESGFGIKSVTETPTGLNIEYEATDIYGYIKAGNVGQITLREADIYDYIKAGNEGKITLQEMDIYDYIKAGNEGKIKLEKTPDQIYSTAMPAEMREADIYDYIRASTSGQIKLVAPTTLTPDVKGFAGGISSTAIGTTAAIRLSTDFYASIGHPEFGGKYMPFDIPAGSAIASLKEVTVTEHWRGFEANPIVTETRLEATFTGKQPEVQVRSGYLRAKTGPYLQDVISEWLSGTYAVGGLPGYRTVKITRGEALGVVAVGAVPILAPITAPFLGLSTGGLIASAGVSVGVSEAASLIMTGKSLSLGQAIQAGLIGEVLAIGSSAVLKGASKISPIFTRSITESISTSGLRGVLVSVGSRAAIFSTIGATTGYVLSGGDIKQAELGAISGAAFSVGGDVLKYGVERGIIPVPKYGSVNIPLEIQGQEGEFYAEQPTWRGLYLSRGENAKLLLGKFSDIPEIMGSQFDIEGVSGRIATHGVSGEEAGWHPVSNIESAVTLRAMNEMGYNPQVIEDIIDIRQIMSTTQYTKSKFIEDMLPSETGTLSEKGVSNLKDYILKDKAQVSELFGRFGTNPQLSTEFEYTFTTPSGDVISALRPPSDIDIQLTTSDLEAASKFTSGALKVLGEAGDIVRISPEKPTLIEANIGGKWAHAVDIKYEGMPDIQLSAEGGWGFKYSRPTTEIEGLPAMSLSEQGLRKGADSVLGFTEDMGIGPVAHRLKDIPDFFQAQETLLESARPSGKVAEAQSLLSDLAERYNVSLSDVASAGERYIVSSRPTAFQSSFLLVSPQIFAVSKARISPQIVSMRAVSPSILSISTPSIAKLTAYPSQQIGSAKMVSPLLASVSSSKLITSMASSMAVSALKGSSAQIYSSMSKLVSPSNYASKSVLLSPSSAFSKSVSRAMSVSSAKSYPSASSFSALVSPSASVSRGGASPRLSYLSYSMKESPSVSTSSVSPPSYPSLSVPSSPFPSSPSSPSSYSSYSSMLSVISPPHITKKIRLPTFELKKGKNRFGRGEWFKRTHPILEPKQVFKQFWSSPMLSKSNLRTWKVAGRKTKRSRKK